MQIYLMQHGEAKSTLVDPERGLTEEGIENIRKAARWLMVINPEINIIWHSDKKRSFQSAQILCDVYGGNLKLERKAQLAPEEDAELIKEELLTLDKNIIVTGHLPHLSRLAALLLTGNTEIQHLKFCNAGIVCIEYHDRRCFLEWMITPRLIC